MLTHEALPHRIKSVSYIAQLAVVKRDKYHTQANLPSS